MSKELKPCPFCGCHDRRVGVRKMGNLASQGSWKSSRNRENARIWLKVTDVRVERLQEITEAGATKKGCVYDVEYALGNTAKGHFIEIWNSTIKKSKKSDRDRYGWNASPWVWVIEFERCEKPEGV